MDWDLPQLRALAAITDHGSLDAAAAVLHVTPSAVSQRLKALEQNVGAVLVRRTRPVTPTAAGERVLVLARQMAALADAYAGESESTLPVVRLAVNADSLATWALPALAGLSDQVRLELLREDEAHTAGLLRDGTVMGAITSVAEPVQGCSVTPLGAMRYLPRVAPALLARTLPAEVPAGQVPAGPRPIPEVVCPVLDTQHLLTRLPVVVFDDRDTLQDDALAAAGVTADEAPRHLVPASTQFADAVGLGIGWGMVPERQAAKHADDLVPVPGLVERDVTLYWQRWTLHLPSLDAVGDALMRAAFRELHPVPGLPGAHRP